MRHWILDTDDTPVQTGDLMAWAEWFEHSGSKRIVAKTKVGGVTVSTVFLAMDHAFSGGDPILYETMIFGGDYDSDMWRYHTRAEAEAGHSRIVAALEAGESP